ncbi:hypothetical protein BpHYR1_002382, partial [Brachionus plicatilis]
QRKYKAGIYFDHEGPRTNNNIESYHNKLKTNLNTDHPNIYSAIEALKTEENQVAFAYNGKIPVPYRRKLVVYIDASYTFRRQMLILGKLTVDEYIDMILAIMSEEEKKTKKCVAYLGDISDLDSEEEEEIYDDASDEDKSGNNNRPIVSQITQQLPQDLSDHSSNSSGNSSDNLPSISSFLISSGEHNNIIMEEN